LGLPPITGQSKSGPGEDTAQGARWFRRLLSSKERKIQLLALAAGVAFAAALWLFRNTITGLESVGYPGVLVLSALGSGTFIFPVPALASVCGLSLVLSPPIVGLLSGIGEATGELSGYAIGYGTRGALEKQRFYQKTTQWMERRGTLALFIVSIIPNPFFDVVGIAAGSTRFPLIRFFITVWIGKSLKGIMVAYTCWYGIGALPWVNVN